MNQETESASAAIIPPIEYLRECFRYESETGRLLWKERPLHHFPNFGASERFNRYFPGKEFGLKWFQKTTKKPGAIRGRLIYQGRGYAVLCHRAVWMIHNGPIPAGAKIDHINRNPFDNRLENLRLATHSQNLANAADYRGRKNQLPRGVYKNGKKFSAATRKDGKLIYIGSYPTIELARDAYLSKAREVHGEFFKL